MAKQESLTESLRKLSRGLPKLAVGTGAFLASGAGAEVGNAIAGFPVPAGTCVLVIGGGGTLATAATVALQHRGRDGDGRRS